MIINITAEELNQAVTEFVCKRGISPESQFDIKYRAGRKGNPTTATVGINETTQMAQKPSKKAVELPDDMDSDPVPDVSITSFEEEVVEESVEEEVTSTVVNVFKREEIEEKEEIESPKHNPFKFFA
jgi:hypothetical protein